MTFTIIKNAEIPARCHLNGGNKRGTSKYPFAKMEVGDGFDVPRDGMYGRNDKTQTKLRGAVRYFTERSNPSAKFIVRILDETTVRCVRVA
jgi:hypothetical protein